jgi:hypothetical protein
MEFQLFALFQMEIDQRPCETILWGNQKQLKFRLFSPNFIKGQNWLAKGDKIGWTRTTVWEIEKSLKSHRGERKGGMAKKRIPGRLEEDFGDVCNGGRRRKGEKGGSSTHKRNIAGGIC